MGKVGNKTTLAYTEKASVSFPVCHYDPLKLGLFSVDDFVGIDLALHQRDEVTQK